jgi:geranylgeranyl diphosphate synthase type I
VLIAAATYLGAKLGGADPARQKQFQAYGLNLGLAFQFQDDWLGLWGDPVMIGKSVASDLATRKKSLPVVYGLEHSPAFAQAYARPPQPDEDLTALAAWLEQCGAQAYVEEQVARRTEAAVQALEAAQPAEPWAAALLELTQQLLRRNQ